MENGRLQRKIIRQISPHHAIVDSDGQASLQKWLNKNNYTLNTTQGEAKAIDPASYHWLALQILAELGDFSTP